MSYVSNFRLNITNLEHLLVGELALKMGDVQEVPTPVQVVRVDMEDSIEEDVGEGGVEVVEDHTVLVTRRKLKCSREGSGTESYN